MTRLPLLVASLLSLLALATAIETITFDIDPNFAPTTPPINPNLVAFSIEVSDFMRWTSRYPSPTRPAWVNLMQQLMLTPGQEGPRYRIGGDSADQSVYGHPKLPPVPTGRPLSYSVNETDLLSWKQAMAAVNSKMTLDLNFRRGDNATWAVEYVQAIDKVIGWEYVTALEVGNEVDLYGGSEKYRPSGYNYDQYKAEYTYYVQQIKAAVPTIPTRIFQGLVNIGWDWLANNLDDYLSTPEIEQSLYSISQHNYPVPSCEGQNVTIDDILNDAYSTSSNKFLKQHDTVAKLRAHNISFVFGEGSDAVCNGNGPMVLNTFATALWVVDQLMQTAIAGVDQFYFHSWGFGTDTFSVLVYGNKAAPDRFLVQPIYYGLRMFAEATANYAHAVQLYATTPNDKVTAAIHAYQTVDNAGVISIVVVHKDQNQTGTATYGFVLTMKQPVNATLIRLTAPFITSEYNVTLAGQTYDGSEDGMPIGMRVEEVVPGVVQQGGGVLFQFVVKPLSAVLLRIPPQPQPQADGADKVEVSSSWSVKME